jgi:hypothetical protein
MVLSAGVQMLMGKLPGKPDAPGNLPRSTQAID